MRDLKLGTFETAKGKKKSNKRTKSFGYQILGFGGGGPGLKFVTATGGCITTCGSFKIHTFNSSGCFVVSCAGEADGSNSVTWLVQAGGGGGGGARRVGGGGGGAGGFRESPSAAAGCYSASPLAGGCAQTVCAQSYPITVGAAVSSDPGTGTGGTGGGSQAFPI